MDNMLNKKQTLIIIKDSQNIKSTIEYNQNYFKMNVKGEIVPNTNKKIIDQFSELISNLEIKLNARFDKIDDKFDKLEKYVDEKFNIINQKLDNHETRLKKIEQLI